MVELKSDKLLDSYKKFLALKNLFNYSQSEVNRRSHDSNFLNAIGFPYLGEKIKDPKAFVGTKLDDMASAIEEVTIIGFVADFENILFNKVDNASGEIAKIVKEKYKHPSFNSYAVDFVKTSNDINKLSSIRVLISNKLSPELAKSFEEVVEFRNRIAHGKRFGSQSQLDLDDIARILDDILSEI